MLIGAGRLDEALQSYCELISPHHMDSTLTSTLAMCFSGKGSLGGSGGELNEHRAGISPEQPGGGRQDGRRICRSRAIPRRPNGAHLEAFRRSIRLHAGRISIWGNFLEDQGDMEAESFDTKELRKLLIPTMRTPHSP